MSKMNYNRKVRKTQHKYRPEDWICSFCGHTPSIHFVTYGRLSGKKVCINCLEKYDLIDLYKGIAP